MVFMKNKIFKAIGLMSGTSLDGVDVALLETDGLEHVRPLGFLSLPYADAERGVLKAALGLRDRQDERVRAAEEIVTDAHIRGVRQMGAEGVDVIGFHGQTILHDPARRFTLQVGDAARMARETGVPVVADFRSADVAAGGQGAPLLPLYHRARVKAGKLKLPVAIINIGGVANVTWIGEDKIMAFDTGPGNALMDDFIKLRTGVAYDDGGRMGAKGVPDSKIMKKFMSDDFFKKLPPKSLDRDHWTIDMVKNLSTEDGMGTLLAMTVRGLEMAFDLLPGKCCGVFFAGGGRKNIFLMDILPGRLPMRFFAKFGPVEVLGWDGDALEAEGFAYLAVRSLLGEPLSLPETTGVPRPMTGGVLYKP